MPKSNPTAFSKPLWAKSIRTSDRDSISRLPSAKATKIPTLRNSSKDPALTCLISSRALPGIQVPLSKSGKSPAGSPSMWVSNTMRIWKSGKNAWSPPTPIMNGIMPNGLSCAPKYRKGKSGTSDGISSLPCRSSREAVAWRAGSAPAHIGQAHEAALAVHELHGCPVSPGFHDFELGALVHLGQQLKIFPGPAEHFRRGL